MLEKTSSFVDSLNREGKNKFITTEMLESVKRHYDSLVENEDISAEAKALVLEVLIRCKNIQSNEGRISIEDIRRSFPVGSLRASESEAGGLSGLRKFKDEAARVILKGLNSDTRSDTFRKKDLRGRQ